MKLLEERIKKDGEVRHGGILKVDSFLNHRIDAQLSFEMAKELKRLYDGEDVNKVLTIEASGIALASGAGVAVEDAAEALPPKADRSRIRVSAMAVSLLVVFILFSPLTDDSDGAQNEKP